MGPQKIRVLMKYLIFFGNAYGTGMSIEHQAHNMPNTIFAFVQSVLTTTPCTSGTLLTYSRMLFNLKINKTLLNRVQRLYSEAQVLLCSWVQLNPQKDYSHPLLGLSCTPTTKYSYIQNAPFVKQEGLKKRNSMFSHFATTG